MLAERRSVSRVKRPDAPALQLLGVSKRFRGGGWLRRRDDIDAVIDVSLEVRPGEVLGLIGQSGSGKTTTGRIAVRLIEPNAGRVIIQGQDVSRLRGSALRKARRQFQMVFQDPYQSLNPLRRVATLLEEPLRIHLPALSSEERTNRVEEMIERVGLSPVSTFLRRYPHELSGGQRQRVAIGRAVIVKPDLLVADEPVSMLDVSVRTGILNLLLDLREAMGMAQLFITHDLAVAKHLCDRVAVLHRGRIVEEGPAAQVLSSPTHSYTRELLAAVPENRLHQMEGPTS